MYNHMLQDCNSSTLLQRKVYLFTMIEKHEEKGEGDAVAFLV